MVGEFRVESCRLFKQFRERKARLIVSDVTLRELADAPARVRVHVDDVPRTNREVVAESDDARELQAYLDAGALPPTSQADALHVALATLAGVDVLASWNFRHMVNWRRIAAYNEVNHARGHRRLDIRTPKDLNDDE